MVICPKTDFATSPLWFPELQWYVEEETYSRKERILPREAETTSREEETTSREEQISSRKDETSPRKPSSVPRFLPLHIIGNFFAPGKAIWTILI